MNVPVDREDAVSSDPLCNTSSNGHGLNQSDDCLEGASQCEVVSSPVSELEVIENHDLLNTFPCETSVILKQLSKQHQDSRLSKCWTTLNDHWTFISSIAKDNFEMCTAACEHLARVRASLIAEQNKPAVPALPASTSDEPANKKAPNQRRFLSTKRRAIKRKPELSVRKPSRREKAQLLAVLDGNVEIVSRNLVDTDHDYDVSESDLIHFEHSYE